jgi:hypothetical protein
VPPKVRGAQGAQCHLQSQGRSAAYYLYLGGYARTEGMIGERLSAPIPCRSGLAWLAFSILPEGLPGTAAL